jgi:hypothetical protein
MTSQYYKEYGRVMNIRSNRESFAQLVGEHACRMSELTKAEGGNSKRGLMASWVNIHKLNGEWAGLVTRGERNDETEFSRVTHQLIEMYSEALGDYVLDKVSAEKIDKLVTMEQRFFEALGGNVGCTRRKAGPRRVSATGRFDLSGTELRVMLRGYGILASRHPK